MNTTIGTCSICGGRVSVPETWLCVNPPIPRCESCGATMARPWGPVIPMTPGGDKYNKYHYPEYPKYKPYEYKTEIEFGDLIRRFAEDHKGEGQWQNHSTNHAYTESLDRLRHTLTA